MSFNIDDALFANIRKNLTQDNIDLINASPLMCSLLDSYQKEKWGQAAFWGSSGL